MKRFNQKYFTIAVYALAVFAFAVLFLLLGLNFQSFLSFVGSLLGKIGAIFYGIFFALILLPFVKMFDRMYTRLFCRKKPRGVLVAVFSLTTTYFLLLVLFFTSVAFLIPAAIDNFTELYDRLSTYFGTEIGASSPLAAVKDWLASVFKDYSPVFMDIIESLEAYLSESILNVQSAGSLVAKFASFLGFLFSQLSDIFLGLILSVYLLASRRSISGICGKLVVALFSERFAVKFVIFFKRLYTNFCDFASIRILISFVVFVSVFVLSWIAGIPMFSVIAIILFFTQLVPVLGTLIGILISSVIVLILSPVRAIFFIPALIALEIVVANLVTPLFLKKALRPTFGTSAVVVLVGYALLGVAGAFLAVPVYATLNVEFRAFLAARLAKKKMPISTEAYEKGDIGTILSTNASTPDASQAESEDAPAENETK